jgi:3-octaprenyl-4-hydroxybenzoate carboxy-lyase
LCFHYFVQELRLRSNGQDSNGNASFLKNNDASLFQERWASAKIGKDQFKHLFVVDDDVDIFDELEVLWCMGTHFQGDQDLAVIPYALGNQLTPNPYDIAERSAYGSATQDRG